MNESNANGRTVSLSPFPRSKQVGGNALSTQQSNRALLLRLIKDHRIISRVELARLTGLKKATITININEFLNVGLVCNAGHIESDSGRKVRGICIAPNNFYVISVRLSTSFFSLALHDINSDCIIVRRFEFDSTLTLRAVFGLMRAEIQKFISLVSSAKVIAIGVGYDGVITLSDWPVHSDEEFDLEAALTAAFDIPVMINSSLYFSTYQWRHLSEYNMSLHTFMLVNVGPVVSSFLQASPETLLTGSQGYAGSIGRIGVGFDANGNVLTLDDVLTADAIIKTVRQMMPDYPDSILNRYPRLTIQRVIDAYEMGDSLARDVYERAFRTLGRLFSELINFSNPDCIVLNGDIPYSEDVLRLLKEESSKNIHPNAKVDIIFDSSATSSAEQNDPILSGISLFLTNRSFKSIVIT